MIVMFLLPGVVAVRRCSCCTRSSRAPLQPLRLERARAAHRFRRDSTTSARPSDDPVFRDSMRHNAIIIVLSLLLQIPFALGLAVMLNQKLRGRALMRTLFFAPYILSEVVTGVVWRQILRPSGLLDQIARSASEPRGHPQEWLADPDVVALQPVLRHLVEVLRVPHGDPARRAAADPQRARARRPRSTAPRSGRAFRYVTLPLLGPTVRVSIFLSIIGALQLFDLVWVTTKGGPIDATRRWRPTSSTRVSDAASSATRAPSRSSSSGSRSSSRCCTSGSRCAATFEGLVSLAELTPRCAPAGSGGVSGRHSSTSSRSGCSAHHRVPLTFSVLGGFRDQRPARRAIPSACPIRG